MKRMARWAVRLIGPLLLLVFLWRSNPVGLLENLRGLVWWPLLLSLALVPVFLIVKAWRWNVVMRELGMDAPPLWYSVVLYTIGLYAGGITPGQSGDFVKAWYLRQRGQPLATALFSIVLDRLFDFAVMAGLALVGLVVVLDVFPPNIQAGLQTSTVVFAAVIFLLTPMLMARGLREWSMGLATRMAPARFRPALERLREQFAPLSLRPGPLLQLLVASAASASTTLLRIFLLFWTLPLADVPPLAVIGSTALIAILQALPISFAGVGVRDAVLIALLQRYGHTTEQALVLSAQYLLINIEHILLGFLVSLRFPLESGSGADAALPQADRAN